MRLLGDNFNIPGVNYINLNMHLKDKMETNVLLRIHEDLEFIKQKVIVMDNELEDISKDLHIVRPEYLKKLEKIKEGKFYSFNSKEKFLQFLDNEI